MKELCPKIETTLGVLGKKWTGLIIYRLLDSNAKFSELEQYIPHLSARMLTERLKELEQTGIIVKNVYPTTPVKIEYSLTDKGRDLEAMFSELGEWAEKWN